MNERNVVIESSASEKAVKFAIKSLYAHTHAFAGKRHTHVHVTQHNTTESNRTEHTKETVATTLKYHNRNK